MATIVERLAGLPSATVSDVLRNLQTTYCSDPAIRPLVPGLRVAGTAFTVLARGGSILTVHKALFEAPLGRILVVGGETPQQSNGARFGKLMATGLAEQAVPQVEEKVKKEDEYLARMQAGEQLGDLIGFSTLIYGDHAS